MQRIAASLLLVCAAFQPTATQAQSYFQNCVSNTGKDATLLVDAFGSHIVGTANFENGDEIAVYTEDGQCVGAKAWNGENLAISIWGDDPFDSKKKGLLTNEPFMIRVWDKSASILYGEDHGSVSFEIASSPPFVASKMYITNALYMAQSIHATESVATGKNLISTAVLKDYASERGVDNMGILSITRNEPYNDELDVYFSLSGTAVNGADYQTIEETAIFSPGQRSVYVVIRPVDDGTEESGETVQLDLFPDPTYFVDNGALSSILTIRDGGSTLATEDETESTNFELQPPYPNPFATRTVVKFRTNTTQRLRVDVYNLIGKRVAAIFDGTIQANIDYDFLIDANQLPDGMYFVKATGIRSAVRSVVLRR